MEIEKEKRIQGVLKKHFELTITQIVTKTKLTRSAVRIVLAKLEGAKKISLRKIGMAKVYSLKRKK